MLLTKTELSGSASSLLLSLRRLFTAAALLAAAALGPRGAAAQAVLLNFEGAGSGKGSPVGNFYGPGGAGTDYGVVFGPNGIGVVDKDATGGSGYLTANEPSGNTTLLFRNGNPTQSFVTVLGDGFTSLSFQYATSNAVDVTVYAGPDLTGALLGTASLPQVDLCGANGIPECGDPTGVIGIWKNVTVPFSGVAKSAGFAPLNYFYLDDLVITLVPPPTNPPTKAPTNQPTKAPTNQPTKASTNRPAKAPTDHPTKSPTTSPANACRKGMKGKMMPCMMMKKKGKENAL